MRTLIIKTIVCCTALLPFAQAQAGAPASKLFGGFAPGKTFSFKVTERVSAQSKGTKIIKKVPVPAGIPNYQVGQKIKFTIGTKGQLTGPGFSMAYKADGGTANAYATIPKTGTSQPNIGQVFKNSTTGRPMSVALSFYKFQISGLTPITNTVVYTLE